MYVSVIGVHDSCLNPQGENSWGSTTNTHFLTYPTSFLLNHLHIPPSPASSFPPASSPIHLILNLLRHWSYIFHFFPLRIYLCLTTSLLLFRRLLCLCVKLCVKPVKCSRMVLYAFNNVGINSSRITLTNKSLLTSFPG